MKTAFAIAAALTVSGSFALQSGPDGDAIAALGAAMLSTGVEIPDGGVPTWEGGPQYTTRIEKCPAQINDEATYLKWKWRTNLADPKTGLDNDALRAGVKKIVAESGWKSGAEDWYDVAARCFDFLVDNVAIGFSEYDCFPAISAWDRHRRPMGAILWSHARDVDDKYYPGLRAEIEQMRKEGRATIGKDFDHSAPDWVDILKIGFPGMKARVDSYTGDTPFYRAEKRAAAAMMRFLDRLIAEARRELEKISRQGTAAPRTKWLEKEIASLERLRVGPPQTVFDVMEFTMVYFILSEPLNYFQVRTFDNIDVRWWPYYQADLAAGRTTEAEFREEFRHFLWQFGSIDNYWGHPMYLGGTNKDGTSAYNPLSLIILDVIEKTALPTPKFQLKMAKNTPDEIWWKALDMLRKHAPLCLMSEENMAQSMKPVGLTDEECRDLLIWGCFEYLPRAKGNCTSATCVYLTQPLVEMMEECKGSGCAPYRDFNAFKAEYLRRLLVNVDRTLELLREDERHLAEINPALMLSLAMGDALEKGVDAFSLGYKYNFTALSETGFATAIDSLLAIKEFVYDKKIVSLAELGRILAADWKGHEELRLRMKNSKFKWGCGNAEADALAKEVQEAFSGSFVGKPNGRGGVFVCYGLNSRGFIRAGKMTPATPDGRKAGEHLSKNMAPSVGAETEGVTGSIKSYGALAPENFPCGSIYDVMIHPSTVAGDKGLRTLRILVERFFAGGGVAMNINIVSPETLRDAQKHPEKYENLQVRVAGWNIRWNDIPRKEQDEYIARIEAVGAGL
jgi:formate C-acetyltransferase